MSLRMDYLEKWIRKYQNNLENHPDSKELWDRKIKELEFQLSQLRGDTK